MPPVIEVRNLTKIYNMGDHEVRALRGVSLAIEPGEFVAVTGPVGIRQVHLHAHRRLPRQADERRLHPGRQGRLQAVEGRAGARAEPEDRLRVPGLQPADAHHGARQRRAAAALRRQERAETVERHKRAMASLDAVGLGHAVSPHAEPAVRRPAAARGDRARAGQRAVDYPGGRAHRQPRHADQHRGHGHLPAAQPRAGHHGHPDHARDGHRRVRHAAHPLPRRPRRGGSDDSAPAQRG